MPSPAIRDTPHFLARAGLLVAADYPALRAPLLQEGELRGIRGGGGFWRGPVRRFCRGNGGRRGGCWNEPRSRGRPADGRALFDGDWPCHSKRLRPCAWLQSPYRCSASVCDPQTTCATDSQSPPPPCTRYRNTADNPEGYRYPRHIQLYLLNLSLNACE